MEEPATVIDAHGELEGLIKGRNVQILGRFKGEIAIAGRLVLGETARVEAKVTAERAEIAGALDGEVRARAVVITEKGRVKGSLDTQALIMKEGAVLNGTVSAAPAPAKETPARPAAAPAAPVQAAGAAPAPAPASGSGIAPIKGA
jgi:cytoskeletal protein CcmA (bactofilin family)